MVEEGSGQLVVEEDPGACEVAPGHVGLRALLEALQLFERAAEGVFLGADLEAPAVDLFANDVNRPAFAVEADPASSADPLLPIVVHGSPHEAG